MDESVESSLDRIRNAFLNRKSETEILAKRQDAIKRQMNIIIDSKPCLGMSYSIYHYPPSLLNFLIDCGGQLLETKIQFKCFYNTKRTNANTGLKKHKDKWIFNGCCFYCKDLKDICWNAVKNYFLNLKVSFLYSITPTHCNPEIGLMVGVMVHIYLTKFY